MSAKTQFLKKLQAQQSSPYSFKSKSQADIAELCMRMKLLQEQMEDWLVDTGVRPESTPVSLTDLLVEEGAFDVPGIILRYKNRSITFTPLFMYGHGVTGCVEVSLWAEEKATPLSRLFMRAGHIPGWSCTPPGTLFRPDRAFNEEGFFALIAALLP